MYYKIKFLHKRKDVTLHEYYNVQAFLIMVRPYRNAQLHTHTHTHTHTRVKSTAYTGTHSYLYVHSINLEQRTHKDVTINTHTHTHTRKFLYKATIIQDVSSHTVFDTLSKKLS
jgi:hypothetical protein